MSQYKSTGRSQQGTSKPSPYHDKATQLHELFTDLPVDELEILLTEVNGDLQLAAARITDGALQPWEVSRRKDKKPPTTHNPKSSTASRGDSRGARAGRGGRVGARGRGGHPKASGNGHVPQAESTSISLTWDDLANGTTEGSKSDNVEQIAKSTNESHDHQNEISSAWGKSLQAENTTQAWGYTPEGGANGKTSQTTHPPVTRQPSKTPATSNLSWAQIARSQEKPTTVTPLATQLISPPVQEAVPESGLEEVEVIGREGPTTVEGPTWDDSKQSSAPESWPPTDVTTGLAQEQLPVISLESHPEALEPPKASEPLGEAKQEPASTSAPVAATPSPSTRPQEIASPSPKLGSRPPVSSHRSSARYKVTDQPVTLPLSFGAGIEKVGMQFGSLSVGDASTTETSQHDTEAPAAEPTPAAPQSKVEVALPLPSPAAAPPTSTSLTSMFQQQHGTSVSQSQQAQTLPNVQSSIPHHTLPTSISQPIASNQTNVHNPTSTSLHQFSQHQASAQQQQPTPTHNVAQHQHQSQHQAPHHQPQSQHVPHLPQQLQQNQPVHSLNQHAMLVHLDQTQQTQTQQPLQPTAHSNYFRGSETSATTPYFHAPTPPVAQTQDSSYGSFGQLSSQGQHQQTSHSNTFGSNDYPYSDRFYESYTAQQQAFTTRNPLHDDIKTIPGGQQNATSTLPPSAAQGSQAHTTQAPGQQAQPGGGQGPQQTYPPPVPYYFPHAYPQNQYYGSPYSSGYVPQPFVKYPTMFQPGPPGPGSGGNPVAKQPGNVGVQPQTPYNGSLYQQAGYEEYQTHQQSQHQHQHSHSLGLGQGMTDYSKQLYGAGQGSMQGFMGLGGQNNSGGTGPASNARGSPEAPYKPYVKDVNVARSVQGQQGQGQVPPQSQVQGPTGQGSTGQGFYGGNRFGGGASTSSVGGGPQQAGQQGHLGYPQGVNDANFYGYQPRQQQGYWQ